MPIFTINVKWQKEKYSDVEVDTDQPPEVFKATMYSLTGVPPDRQKVMMPGGILKDDSWAGIKLKNGLTVMMMGGVGELPKAPISTERPTFVEDLKESELIKAMELPQGLTNLGNTCYMNATVQCLYSIPELRMALSRLETPLGASEASAISPHVLSSNLYSLFRSMTSASQPIAPYFFLACLQSFCPQFAATQPVEGGGGAGPSGVVFMQQDANECWTELVRAIQKVPTNRDLKPRVATNEEVLPGSFGQSGGWNFVDRFLSGELECQLTNTEAADEGPIVTREMFCQLSCFIDKDVKYLHSGLRSGLEGQLTKQSPSLGRNAVYKKVSRISRLPGYLSVQFVRFYYKEKENVNAKVLKDVKFPVLLDLFEFCTEELQKKLMPTRERFKEEEDQKLAEASAAAPGSGKKGKTDLASIVGGATNLTSRKEAANVPYWLPEDPGSNNSGYYELQAVLTHQGRSSSSGHYVAWVRRHDDDWCKFDDDKVSPVTTEEILRLSGGGDWHCAYVLLYGSRRLEQAALTPASTTGSGTTVDSQQQQHSQTEVEQSQNSNNNTTMDT